MHVFFYKYGFEDSVAIKPMALRTRGCGCRV